MKKSGREFQRRMGVAAVAAAMVCGVGEQTASAQQTVSEVITANQGFITTLGVMTTASTVVYITQRVTDHLLAKVFADAHQYMEHNAVALRQDVSVGSGETLEDLATIYRLQDEGEVSQLRRRVAEHRSELLAILGREELTLEDAVAFTLLVVSEEQLKRLE